MSVELPSTAAARRQRSDDADRLVGGLFASATGAAGADASGVAVVAVGGYGRRELSPFSDLDLVLLHDPGVPHERVDEVANALWYPLWDEGVSLDHAVRDTEQMREAARTDHRAAMGMLDARAVAGDANLVLTLRSHVLADWRRNARANVEQLREGREQRIERTGWVAYAAIPDLKESGGGLRDGVDLRGLVATWLVDVPHARAEGLRSGLLDVRDALHSATGRRSDRLLQEYVVDTAQELGVESDELDLHVRLLGRQVAHLVGMTWRRLDAVLAPRPSSRPRTAPAAVKVDEGVARLDDEVVVLGDADPVADPAVALRAAAYAARHGLVLAPSSADRLARDLAPLPEPWPAEARRSLVELLTSGPGLRPVWEELDIAGVVDLWLPEWGEVRLRGSSSPVHQWTVDRHSLETAVIAAELRRDVDRPDLLAVAALLHDIGKGRPDDGEHSEVGAPMAEAIATRWGFGADDAAVVARLVRWHLLLPTLATRRDIEDPSTAANVADIVGTTAFLDHLAALTQADARSTGPTGWTSWRRGLIEGLVDKTREQLAGEAVDDPDGEYAGWPLEVALPSLEVGADEALADVRVEDHQGGSLLTVLTADRPGVMARIAGGLALQGLTVRAVRMITGDGVAASLWEVTRPGLDGAAVGQRLRPVLADDVDLAARMVLKPVEGIPARVTVLPGRSETATVLEVRAADRRGLVWTVCHAIAEAGHSIRSAHLSTYGDEARDVFYVVDAEGEPLDAEHAASLREAVDAALV